MVNLSLADRNITSHIHIHTVRALCWDTPTKNVDSSPRWRVGLHRKWPIKSSRWVETSLCTSFLETQVWTVSACVCSHSCTCELTVRRALACSSAVFVALDKRHFDAVPAMLHAVFLPLLSSRLVSFLRRWRTIWLAERPLSDHTASSSSFCGLQLAEPQSLSASRSADAWLLAPWCPLTIGRNIIALKYNSKHLYLLVFFPNLTISLPSLPLCILSPTL